GVWAADNHSRKAVQPSQPASGNNPSAGAAESMAAPPHATATPLVTATYEAAVICPEHACRMGRRRQLLETKKSATSACETPLGPSTADLYVQLTLQPRRGEFMLRCVFEWLSNLACECQGLPPRRFWRWVSRRLNRPCQCFSRDQPTSLTAY